MYMQRQESTGQGGTGQGRAGHSRAGQGRAGQSEQGRGRNIHACSMYAYTDVHHATSRNDHAPLIPCYNAYMHAPPSSMVTMQGKAGQGSAKGGREGKSIMSIMHVHQSICKHACQGKAWRAGQGRAEQGMSPCMVQAHVGQGRIGKA